MGRKFAMCHVSLFAAYVANIGRSRRHDLLLYRFAAVAYWVGSAARAGLTGELSRRRRAPWSHHVLRFSLGSILGEGSRRLLISRLGGARSSWSAAFTSRVYHLVAKLPDRSFPCHQRGRLDRMQDACPVDPASSPQAAVFTPPTRREQRAIALCFETTGDRHRALVLVFFRTPRVLFLQSWLPDGMTASGPTGDAVLITRLARLGLVAVVLS